MSLVFDFPFALPASGVDPRDFMNAMASMPSPVSVITTLTADGKPTGATLPAVCSLSLNPPLFLACFDHRSETLRAIRGMRKYLVHILAGSQADLAKRFASKSADKFEGVDWEASPSGLPQIKGCRLVMACRLFSMMPGGDHTIVAGEVEAVTAESEEPAMVYVDRRMTIAGQESATT